MAPARSVSAWLRFRLGSEEPRTAPYPLRRPTTYSVLLTRCSGYEDVHWDRLKWRNRRRLPTDARGVCFQRQCSIPPGVWDSAHSVREERRPDPRALLIRLNRAATYSGRVPCLQPASHL